VRSHECDRSYEPPAISVVGTVEDITQGTGTSGFDDGGGFNIS
jgi:hypothetical protein